MCSEILFVSHPNCSSAACNNATVHLRKGACNEEPPSSLLTFNCAYAADPTSNNLFDVCYSGAIEPTCYNGVDYANPNCTLTCAI